MRNFSSNTSKLRNISQKKKNKRISVIVSELWRKIYKCSYTKVVFLNLPLALLLLLRTKQYILDFRANFENLIL